MAARKSKIEPPKRGEGPAVESQLHVWGRPATDDLGRTMFGTVGCTKLTPFEAYARQGKLAGGNKRYDAIARQNAGLHYARIWHMAQPGTTDSTQKVNVVRSPVGGGGATAVLAAKNLLARVDSLLGARDRRIIQMVIGQEYQPAEAIRATCADYEDTVAARFRESLDALCDAFAAVR